MALAMLPTDLYAYLSDLRGHLLAILSAGPFLIDRLITWFWPSGRKWLDNFPHRRSLFLWIIVGGTFYAGFLAWREEYYRRQNAERSLELAKSSLELATQASADLKFNGITPNKDPRNGLNYFNIEIINSGPLTGTNVVIKTEGTLSDHTLTKGETDLWLAKLYKEVDDADKIELSSDQLHSKDKSIFTIPNVTPTDEQLSAIDKATLSLYVFVVARYEDRNVQGKSYYTMQFCGYFIATRKYWHNCAPNKTTKTVGSRAK